WPSRHARARARRERAHRSLSQAREAFRAHPPRVRGAAGMTSELAGFVRESLARGIPREQIQDALRRAGWQADEVEAALAEWADSDFPVPVPRRKPYLSA